MLPRQLATLSLITLVALGCKEKEKSQEAGSAGKSPPPSAAIDAAPHGTGEGITPRKGAFSGRNKPPVFKRVANSGLLFERCGERLVWVERRKGGNVLVGVSADAGDSKEITEPTPPILHIACDDTRVVWAADGIGVKGPRKPGVYTAKLDGGATTKLSDKTGKVALVGESTFLVIPGTSKKPGEVWKLAPGKPSRIAQHDTKFGRVAVATDGSALYILGDKRVPLAGSKGKVRKGFINKVTADGEMKVLADTISGPGTQLVHYMGTLYFTGTEADETRRGLFSLEVSGGTPKRVFEKKWEVARFTVDASGIFAMANYQGWKLIRLVGQSFGHIAQHDRAPASHLRVLGEHVYFASSGIIYRVETKKPNLK